MTRGWPVVAVAGGLAVGAAFHAADFVRYGWWPYAFGPAAANLFWNALLPLDVAIAALVLWRPRAGLPAACVLMAADVAVNAYAWRGLGFDSFAGAVPVQATFGAFTWWAAWRQRLGVASTSGWSSKLP